MPVHTMTPIHEEIESTMPEIAGTPILKEEAGVSINVAADTTTQDGKKEEVETSSSASTVVPVNEEEEELDSGMIAIGYFFNVPSVKWHPELEMMSRPGLTQGQYEQRVLAQGYVHDFLCRLRHPQFIHPHDFMSRS